MVPRRVAQLAPVPYLYVSECRGHVRKKKLFSSNLSLEWRWRNVDGSFVSAGLHKTEEGREQPYARLLARVRQHKFALPPISGMTSKRLLILTSAGASVKELLTILQCDSALASRVLSVANSAIFNAMAPISSIRQASLRLGQNTLRDLILQAVIESQFKSYVDDRLLDSCKLHAVAVAHLAKETCKLTGADPSSAFMCGLLHDIGTPVLVHALAKGGFDGPLPEAAHSAIHSAHTIAGEQVAELWSLPSVVGDTIRLHHCIYGAIDSQKIAPEVAIVGASDRLAYHLNLGGRNLGTALFDDPTWEQVGLTVEDVQSLIAFSKRIPSAL